MIGLKISSLEDTHCVTQPDKQLLMHCPGERIYHFNFHFHAESEYILQESLMNWFSGCVSSEDDMARAILRDKNYL